MLNHFLETIWQSKDIRKRVESFDCKSNCHQCGLCVKLAADLGLQISTDEMEQARREFVGGTLMVDGVNYKPDPIKVRELRLRKSIYAFLNGVEQARV